MRIESLNQATGETASFDLPPKLNPVWIGRHPKCHVILNHPDIGGEAGAIDNDVSGGTGWRFWNRQDGSIRVDGVPLAARNQWAPLRARKTVIECPPFLLTVRLTEDEWASASEDATRLDRRCGEFVRDVHAALLALHPTDPADRREWLRDGYVYELERQIAGLAEARPDFPTPNGPPSELGDHMAGLALRAATIQKLTAEAGGAAATESRADWAAPRLTVPEFERMQAPAVEGVIRTLNLGQCPDLSEQVVVLDNAFRDYWTRCLEAGVLDPPTRRYLGIRRLVQEVKNVWYGFGPLEDLLEDPSVTEIMVVAADKIFIEKGGRIEQSGRRFFTDPVTIIQRIMALANRQINAAQPLADARLPDGSRANAIIEPLALTGPCLTIRRFPRQRLTVGDLVDRLDALTPAARDFLRAAVQNRRNLIVSGGTGTGKTTMLNCLTAFIDPRDRIVTVEDTAELQVQQKHVVTLQARPKNLEGAGAIPIRDLVRNTLRMRPDRIIVGECRGGEAIDMLQAMNTGHDGSMTTLHANDPAGAIHRLVTLVQENADIRLPVDVIHRQIVSAVDLIVQLGEIYRDGRRRRAVIEIAEVAGFDAEDNVITLTPLFRRIGNGPLGPTGHLPTFLDVLIADGLIADPVALVRTQNAEASR